VQERT